jgi:hypothetical protein
MGAAIRTLAVDHTAAYQTGQLLGLVMLALLVFWFLRRAKRRSDRQYEALAPRAPTASEIMAMAAGPNGSAPTPAAEVNGSDRSDPVIGRLDAELRMIYERVGKPDAFDEAKGKVTDLATELVERDGIDMGEALRTAYRRSVTEHREYLVAKGLA